jgi:hypothetical protein
VEKNEIEWESNILVNRFVIEFVEWEVIDSAGFLSILQFLIPKNDQPYSSYEGPLVPYKNIQSISIQ